MGGGRMPPAAPCPGGAIVHANCVALGGRGLLITGVSGGGKSALALQLMAFGATLVADDRVCLQRAGGDVIASAPETIRGLIEARGIGLLRAEPVPLPVALVAVVDLDHVETVRLPERRTISVLGRELPLLYRSGHPHFAAGVLQFLKAGRSET